MTTKKLLAGLATAALLSVGAAAQATLLGATVNITAENGFSSGTSNCKSASAIGITVAGGGELVGGDWTGGCVGYYGADITGSQITLTPIEWGNYNYAHFRLDVVSGATITGAGFSGYTSDFFSPSYPNNDTNFLPVVTFGANFVDVIWDTLTSDQFAFNGPLNSGSAPFGTAVFSISTGTAVPAPASLGLLVLALAGCAVSRRKRS
ncbi:MAG: PEP-CTERM sorting domain-containing protein [Burkholderiales bacterium]|nr:PEP-CTERM sorting domain-containing protein [Burkholderiales bacterium]